MTVAFIGTGLIGAGMAEAALDRGEDVVVWNRTRDKAAALGARGATVAATPGAAVAQAEHVHLALTADDAVDEQLEAIGGHLLSDAVVVDHSTTLPERTAERAARCASAGIAFLHAPVFMSPRACRASKGWMLVAGPSEVFDRVEAALAAMTGDLWFVGERADRAAALKLLGNAMVVTMVAGLRDIFAIGKELGVDPGSCVDLFERFEPTAVLRTRGRNMAEGRYEAAWTLSMARKDVTLMQEAAGEQVLALLPTIAERMDALVEAGAGDRDVGVLAREVVAPR